MCSACKGEYEDPDETAERRDEELCPDCGEPGGPDHVCPADDDYPDEEKS